MAEGGRLVHQGLDCGWKPGYLAITEEGLSRPHLNNLAARAASMGARVMEVPEALLSQISGKDNPGAVVAAFQQQNRDLSSLTPAITSLWIGLYQIRDPGNLGTILRTADCIGAAGVILIGTCCDPYSVEAVRASMGAVFDIPFATADFQTFDSWRQSTGATLVAASVNGTKRHDALAFGGRTVILIGNEQAGLPEEIERVCDHLALIPMRAGADSLNLAQATAIMAYEAWRAHGYPGAAEPA